MSEQHAKDVSDAVKSIEKLLNNPMLDKNDRLELLRLLMTEEDRDEQT